MNSLKEKRKWKDILLPAIDIFLAAIAAVLIILIILVQTGKTEVVENTAAKIAELEIREAELVEDISAAELLCGETIAAAEKKYRAAATEEKKMQDRYAQLSDVVEKADAEIVEIYNYPQKIAQAKREYASKIAELEQKILNGESDIKIAYLTFDDGPYRNTAAILDTLKEHDAKATFFTNGHRSYADLLRREMQEGHAVANHTFSHGISTGLYSSVNAFMRQVEKQDEFVYSTTGFHTELVRFPGGSSTAGRLKEGIKTALIDAGYAWADWDALTGDSTAGAVITRNFVMGNLKSSVKEKPITVILLHDLKKITRNTIDETLDYLESKGYVFLPLFYESCKVNK